MEFHKKRGIGGRDSRRADFVGGRAAFVVLEDYKTSVIAIRTMYHRRGSSPALQRRLEVL